MPTYAWVAIGMLTAGIGGALATWGSMFLMYRGLEPQAPEVLGNLTALGGVFAGICGGLASISRGQKANHKDFKGGLAAIGLGLGVIAVINPGFLFSPFLLVVAPLQGLAALLGGFAALAVLWAVLSLAGIRDESDSAIPFKGSAPTPLSKIGLIAIALGCFAVDPLLQRLARDHQYIVIYGRAPALQLVPFSASRIPLAELRWRRCRTKQCSGLAIKAVAVVPV